MLHQPITRSALRGAPRATREYVRSQWGRGKNLYLHVYLVHPPYDTPILPSDEALRNLVGSMPEIRFNQCIRHPDHDVLEVYGPNGNPFTARADKSSRLLRDVFLAEVAAQATSTREIPKDMIEATEALFAECGFKSITWSGKNLVAYSHQGNRFESRIPARGYDAELKRFSRLCTQVLPFTYEAAQK